LTPVADRVFLHGLGSSSRGTKATWFRNHFPDMLIPDLVGGLDERLRDVRRLLAGREDLIMVGSSFGGLVATVYALENEHQLAKVILLAPALNHPDFAGYRGRKTTVPASLFIGRMDGTCPPETVVPAALETFTNLMVHESDDDHLLRATFPEIDWHGLLAF